MCRPTFKLVAYDIMNPIGIISMQFARPFTGADLHYFQTISNLGFDFVELLVPEPEDQLPLADVKSAAEDAGLFVILAARLNHVRSIASEEPVNRQGGMEYLKRCIEVACELGVRIVGGPLYGEPLVFAGRAPVPRNDSQVAACRERTILGFSDIAPLAHSANVTLAVEPLNRFETDVLSTTRQAVEVLDAVDSPALKLLLDTFHMNIEENSIPLAIRLAGDRIAHFQANENHRGHLGSGHIDWSEILQALAQVNYQGPISLEPFRRDDDRVGLPIAHWRPPHEDEGPKLQAGLDMIRNTVIQVAK